MFPETVTSRAALVSGQKSRPHGQPPETCSNPQNPTPSPQFLTYFPTLQFLLHLFQTPPARDTENSLHLGRQGQLCHGTRTRASLASLSRAQATLHLSPQSACLMSPDLQVGRGLVWAATKPRRFPPQPSACPAPCTAT